MVTCSSQGVCRRGKLITGARQKMGRGVCQGGQHERAVTRMDRGSEMIRMYAAALIEIQANVDYNNPSSHTIGKCQLHETNKTIGCKFKERKKKRVAYASQLERRSSPASACLSPAAGVSGVQSQQRTAVINTELSVAAFLLPVSASTDQLCLCTIIYCCFTPQPSTSL